MARKAVVEKATGRVLNVIDIEDGANWPIPSGCQLVSSDAANTGDIYKDGKFTTPAPIPEPPSLKDEYAAANTDTEKLEILARQAGLK